MTDFLGQTNALTDLFGRAVILRLRAGNVADGDSWVADGRGRLSALLIANKGYDASVQGRR